MPIWPFKHSRADRDAAHLLAAVTTASRRSDLFGPGRAPDTLVGRFELMTLTASLALLRLRAEPGLAPLSQAFTDRLFREFDAGLREAGVGDTSVPKRMHRMAGDFYGRLSAYTAAIDARDQVGLATAIGRNVLGDDSHPHAANLARLALATAERQSGAPVEALFDADGWPAAAQ